jgi:hypothetical protein
LLIVVEVIHKDKSVNAYAFISGLIKILEQKGKSTIAPPANPPPCIMKTLGVAAGP